MPRGSSPWWSPCSWTTRARRACSCIDDAWRTLTIALPPRGSRRVRRIDIRTSVVRDDNHGVKLGEIHEIASHESRRERAQRVATRPERAGEAASEGACSGSPRRRMRAIEIALPGGPDVLRPVTRPVPGRAPVRSSSAWPPRASTGPTSCSGWASIRRRPAPPTFPAWKSAERSSTAADAGAWRVGQRVCALVSGGGYAEYCAAPVEQCLRIPDGSRQPHAAAIPETFFTVWTNLFERGRLQRGPARPRPRRHERHRHDGDSARARVRRRSARDRRIPTEVRGLPPRLARRQPSTTTKTDFVAAVRTPPPATASTSSSTSSAATTCRATSTACGWTAGSCRSG